MRARRESAWSSRSLLGPTLLVAVAACSAEPPPRPAPPPPPPPATAEPVVVKPPLPPPEEPPVFVLQDSLADETISFSPDGRLVASCKQGAGSLHLWSAASQRLLATYALKLDGCSAMSWSPGGEAMAALGYRDLCAWDFAHVPESQCSSIEPGVRSVWSTSRGFLLTRTGDKLQVLDATTAKITHTLRPSLMWSALVALSDSGKLAAGSVDNHLEIWTTDSDAVAVYSKGQASFSHDDRFLATIASDGGRIFDLATRESVKELGSARVVWSPEGAVAAIIDANKRASVWTPDVGEVIAWQGEPGASYVTWLGSQRLAIVDTNARLRVYDLAQKTLRDWNETAGVKAVRGLFPSPSGNVVVVNSDDLRTIDAQSGLPRSIFGRRPGRVDVGFRTNDAGLESPTALVFEDQTRLVDLGVSPPFERGAFAQKKVTPRRRRAWWSGGAFLTQCGSGVVALLRSTGEQRFLSGANQDTGWPLFSDDGRSVAQIARGEVFVRDARGAMLLRQTGDAAALSPDGSVLATWSDKPNTVRFVALPSGAPVSEITGLLGSVSAVRFSPNGSLVTFSLTSFASWTMFVYDLRARKIVKRLDPKTTAATFSPDGTRLVTARTDLVEIFDVKTWKKLVSFPGRSPDNQSFFWSPDSKKLVVNRAPSAPWNGFGTSAVDAATGAVLARFNGGRDTSWLADSSGIVARQGQGIVRLALGTPNAPTSAGKDALAFRRSFSFGAIIGSGEVAQMSDTNGDTVLVRLSDGAELWVDVAERGDQCRLFAYDEEGHFDGDPMGRIAYRIGSDLRSARLDDSEETLAAQRRQGMLAERFADRSPAPVAAPSAPAASAAPR